MEPLPAPALPTTFLDLVPFLFAGYVFTILLIEDGPSDGKYLAGSTQSWLAINGGSSACVRMVHVLALELLWLLSN